MTEISAGGKSVNSFESEYRNRVLQSEAAKAKAEVSRTAIQRIQAYELAVRLLPVVERARRELTAEFEEKGYSKKVGDNAIAKWLRDNGHQASQGGDWGRKQVREVLMRAPERIIECAVLECRTRMTELTLSADFTKPIDNVTELEREYLDYIVQALELEHRLNGNHARTNDELLRDARDKAIEVAARQRSRKPTSMMARERLWKHFPPIVRKVFEK